MGNVTRGALTANSVLNGVLWDGWKWDFGAGEQAFTYFLANDTGVGWTVNQAASYTNAIAAITSVANLTVTQTNNRSSATFVENVTTSTQMSYMTGSSSVYGFHGTPQAPVGGYTQTIDASRSAVFLSGQAGGFYNNALAFTNNALMSGGNGFWTLVHELGHGFGLKHPHDIIGSAPRFPGVTSSASLGTNNQNHMLWTMMSYIGGYTFDASGRIVLNSSSLVSIGGGQDDIGYIKGPMAYDIAALQHMYGIKASATGDNIYDLPDTDVVGTGWTCIWDTGGNDTLRYTGSRNAILDLTAAKLDGSAQGGGVLSYAAYVHGGYTIANGVVIENAIGGSGNDSIVGNSANNELNGGNGADTLIGGAGDDTLVFDNLDTLDGGTGIDFATAYYSPARIGITTHLVGIEGVYGSAFNDVVNAAGQNVGGTFYGYHGNDAIYGSGFADFISGGLGFDTLDGGGGNDTIEFDFLDVVTGGSGIDFATAFYSTARIGITTHLAGFEGVYGSAFNDVFNAAGQNVGGNFYGYNGNDAIYGTGFADFISGGAGADTIDGGGGDDNIEFDHLDTVTGGAGFDFGSAFYSEGAININTAAVGIEGIYGTRFNDVINARSQGSDGSFYGYDGHDVIYSTWFADAINGGNGFDYVVYGGQSSAYTWSRSGSNWLVRETSTGVTDTLTAVEVLRFDNTQVVL